MILVAALTLTLAALAAARRVGKGTEATPQFEFPEAMSYHSWTKEQKERGFPSTAGGC